MVEKDFQVLFGQNIEDIKLKLDVCLNKKLDIASYRSFTFELKIAKDNSIAFNRVEEHQIEGLLKSQSGLYHKISDSPFGGNMKFTSKKPFDCFYLTNAYPFIVICWYKPRELKEMHFIRLNDWVTESKTSTRKSLTYTRSKEICTLCYNLKKI
jgi:hypothetical protein